MNKLFSTVGQAARPAWLLWIAALLLACARPAAAQGTPIPATVTSLTSTADRMISYRQQEHSWQTSDGAIHLMVNRGNVATGDSLVLYSSFDAGATWKQMFTLGATDQFSTSDGLLNDDTHLLLVYAANQASGAINFVSATYSPVSKSWVPTRPQLAFTSTTQSGSNPALSTDSSGNLWCGFTVFDRPTQNYNLQMVYRAAQSSVWTNTGLVFGSTSLSSQHSARPVRFNGGVGMVFQSESIMYWAYRLNAWSVNTPWTTTPIFSGLPPFYQDPYDSHFSVVADASANLYMAFIANQTLYYMRYLSTKQAWGPANPIGTSSSKAAYPQVTLAGSNLLIMSNAGNSGIVLQSTDHGNTFFVAQQLTHPTPPPGSTLDYTNPRIESPSHALNPVPTFQQFANTASPAQGLMYFAVPLLTAPPTKPAAE